MGAAPWTPTGTGIPARVDALALTTNYLWAGTTAGVYRSANGGSSWESFNAGLSNVRVARVVTSGSSAYATTFDGSSGFYSSTDGCASWTGAPSLVGKAFTVIAASGGTVLFSGSGGLYRSTDGGATVTPLTPPKTFVSLAAVGSNFLAVTNGPPVALYRSTDSGATWVPYGSGFPTSASGNITPFAVNGNTLVVALGGVVSRSLDSGATWTTGTVVPWRELQRRLLSPATRFWPRRLSALLQGFYQSNDLGVTWTRAGSGPAQPRDIAVSGSRLLAGATDGAYTSADGGVTWSRFRGELTGIDVNSVAISVEPPAWVRFRTVSSRFRSPRRCAASFPSSSTSSARLTTRPS